MPDQVAPPSAPGWERALGAGVGWVVGAVVAVVLCLVLADRVLTLTVVAAAGLVVAAVVRAVRSRRRVGPFDEARWVALGRVGLVLLGVAVAVRGVVTLERGGRTVAAVEDALWSAGPWPPSAATRLHLMAEIGRPAWELVLSALAGVVLAWLLLAAGALGLRSWAVADRAAVAGAPPPGVAGRAERFVAQRAERLLVTVGLVVLTWMVVRGHVAEAVGWWWSPGSGMSP